MKDEPEQDATIQTQTDPEDARHFYDDELELWITAGST
jgi:hypothetical protein